MKFSDNLIKLRKKEGLSQEELANKLDVSRQTISKWEAGQTTPELEKLRNLAKLFNISVDDFNKGVTYADIMKKNINNKKIKEKINEKQ